MRGDQMGSQEYGPDLGYWYEKANSVLAKQISNFLKNYYRYRMETHTNSSCNVFSPGNKSTFLMIGFGGLVSSQELRKIFSIKIRFCTFKKKMPYLNQESKILVKNLEQPFDPTKPSEITIMGYIILQNLKNMQSSKIHKSAI